MNVDEWIDGAQRTHRSVTIYQRADLIAELDDLDRQIQVAQVADDTDEVDALTEKWTRVAEEFTASALVVHVKGLSDAEFRALRAQAAADRVDNNEFGARLLSAAIVDPPMTPAQVHALNAAVGEPQVASLLAAYHLATTEQPPVPVVEHPQNPDA